MKLDRVKVGIVGLGLVSHSHIDAYRSHPGAELIAVCDMDEGRAKAHVEKYGIPRYYTSYDEMLKDKDINTIDIITPTFLHTSMAIAAAKAGRHIHCEKPFCLSLDEGMAACAEAEKRGVSLMVGESYLFTSSIMKAKELIDSGEIGGPRQIRERFGEWVMAGDALNALSGSVSWRMDSAKAGGGGYPWLFDHCVHFFSVAEYLFNNSPVREIYSLRAKNTSAGTEKINTMTDRDKEVPMIVWTHEDQVCHGVWMSAEPDNGRYDRMTGFSATIIGDKGMIEVLGEGGGGLVWQDKDVHLILQRNGKETLTFRFDEGGDEVWKSEISYYSRAHRNQIHSFVDSLLGGKKPPYDGFDGMRAVRNTMAAICSAKEGVAVTVADVTDKRVGK
jgi:predicted dehydrogenase